VTHPRWARRVSTGALLSGLLGLVLIATASRSATAGAPEKVLALVERAAVYIQAVGRDQGFADITRPDGGFTDGELYVFCTAADGMSLAHGGNPKLVGKHLADLRDPEGTPTTMGIVHVGLTQGRGWFEYLWPNPQAGRIQRKVTFVLRIDDQTVCASGYFKPDPP
jgi:cytochrome c